MLSIAILTAALAMLCAGFIAGACVDWYDIFSFEGKAGYFVVGIALLGGLAGLIIGFVTKWILSSGASPGFFKVLGLSWGIVIVLSALAALISWRLAGLAPDIDGKRLDLAVEFRLPGGDTGVPKASDDTFLMLQAMSGRSVREVQKGTLDMAAVRRENGYWILPGTVYLFTSRGKRLLHLMIDGETSAAVIVP